MLKYIQKSLMNVIEVWSSLGCILPTSQHQLVYLNVE